VWCGGAGTRLGVAEAAGERKVKCASYLGNVVSTFTTLINSVNVQPMGFTRVAYESNVIVKITLATFVGTRM